MKIYYKVLKRECGKYVSAWAVGDARIVYNIPGITTANPMSMGIFVFKTEKSARDFIASIENDVAPLFLFKCKGIGPARQFKKMLSFRTEICKLFYTKSWGKNTALVSVLPDSICFNAIEILEEIHD